MRSFCAIMGSLTVPVVFGIMRESGYPVMIAAFSACLVLFGGHLSLARSLSYPLKSFCSDNGHVTQSRLILLDAALVLFMSLSLFSYIKFHQQRYR